MYTIIHKGIACVSFILYNEKYNIVIFKWDTTCKVKEERLGNEKDDLLFSHCPFPKTALKILQ